MKSSAYAFASAPVSTCSPAYLLSSGGRWTLWQLPQNSLASLQSRQDLSFLVVQLGWDDVEDGLTDHLAGFVAEQALV